LDKDLTYFLPLAKSKKKEYFCARKKERTKMIIIFDVKANSYFIKISINQNSGGIHESNKTITPKTP